MPVVHVYLWAGRSKEQKKEIVKGITNVFTKQKVPSEAVTVINYFGTIVTTLFPLKITVPTLLTLSSILSSVSSRTIFI